MQFTISLWLPPRGDLESTYLLELHRTSGDAFLMGAFFRFLKDGLSDVIIIPTQEEERFVRPRSNEDIDEDQLRAFFLEITSNMPRAPDGLCEILQVLLNISSRSEASRRVAASCTTACLSGFSREIAQEDEELTRCFASLAALLTRNAEGRVQIRQNHVFLEWLYSLPEHADRRSPISAEVSRQAQAAIQNLQGPS